MQLQYLIFDPSDDGEGTGSWEAVASVPPDELSAVMTEVRAVESAAHADAPGPRGALDDGGVWDLDIQTLPDGHDRVSVTLTLTGPWDWGEALLGRLIAP
ncbi:MAG TPA: hypothetical protein PKC60_06465 [Hydrogenophaga sp.]|uniref:hypothetical protein n=1 Tax=Hydrogenophaga sp. TaxID=1904254 RepID=UPI002CDA14BB|nr:hypothetical protein [Hydrogenophaga sp.]HMN92859.1 hypothetical protein [Hydrogenophaga sp.]HMP10886.1 hypothetical protein [Hydrogenophaga sp.]